MGFILLQQNRYDQQKKGAAENNRPYYGFDRHFDGSTKRKEFVVLCGDPMSNYIFSLNASSKGRTIRKVMGVWGIFSWYECFFSRTACAGIFFPGETPCTNFF